MTGQIKRIVRDQKKKDGTRTGGFGFITDENKDERFFHLHDLVNVGFDQITEGDQVEFAPVGERRQVPGKPNDNGLRAEAVSVLK